MWSGCCGYEMISHLIQELHFAGSENLIAKNVFGADEGLSGFRYERFFKYLVFLSSTDMKFLNKQLGSTTARRKNYLPDESIQAADRISNLSPLPNVVTKKCS